MLIVCLTKSLGISTLSNYFLKNKDLLINRIKIADRYSLPPRVESFNNVSNGGFDLNNSGNFACG
jgi:hypothetical protein